MPSPGSAGPPIDDSERTCVLCGKKMFYAKELMMHLCTNKDHGAFAYAATDDCYFTSREDIGGRLQKSRLKFHVVKPEIFQMLGVGSQPSL